MSTAAAIDVLLVEDSPTDVLIAEEALLNRGFRIQSIERLQDALKLLTVQQFDVVLLDLGLPDSQGLDTLRTLRSDNPQIAVVVLTGRDDEEMALKALQEGAQDYLVKNDIESGPLNRSLRYAVERSNSERLLRQSEERLQELTTNIGQVLWVIDAKLLKVLFVSRGYEALSGRSCQSLIENPDSYMDDIHPYDQVMVSRELTSMCEKGFLDVEFRVRRPDQSVRWVWMKGYPVLQDNQIVRFVGAVEDVTEKKRLAMERDALLLRFQQHIERLPLAYILLDEGFRIIEWNPAAADIFGYSKEEMLGTNALLETIAPDLLRGRENDLSRWIRSGEIHANSTGTCLTRKGQTITCEWFNTLLINDKGKFNGVLCLAQDVTAQSLLEVQFQQAQKMEVMGQLAGGVAHDFNNLLTVILGNCEFLKEDVAIGGIHRALIDDIQKAGVRAAALTRQLLAFSRQQILQPKVLNLNEIVTETVTMLRRLIGENIVVVTKLNAALWNVKVDAGQMSQVIMNLAINARDAMATGGTISIDTSNVVLDQSFCETHQNLKPGAYVMLSIQDTGCGINQKTMAHIFEPFFTTKELGKGTGLGLATVFGIVTQSSGYITVESEPDRGATFAVYLPRDQHAPVSSIEAKPESTTPVRGTETVLIVEDEEMMRNLVSYVLKDQGYNVLQARSGEEALVIFQQFEGKIHLVLTDVVMPKLGGRELYDQLRTIQPELKVIFMSGYTSDAAIRYEVGESETNFLQKPFKRETLTTAIRKALDEK